MIIFKYRLTITDEQTLQLPLYSRLLAVQFQGEQLCLWALLPVDYEQAATEPRVINLVGNKQPMDAQRRVYIGTVQQHGGQLVWHVFERIL